VLIVGGFPMFGFLSKKTKKKKTKKKMSIESSETGQLSIPRPISGFPFHFIVKTNIPELRNILILDEDTGLHADIRLRLRRLGRPYDLYRTSCLTYEGTMLTHIVYILKGDRTHPYFI
jgi:hypothetical protein